MKTCLLRLQQAKTARLEGQVGLKEPKGALELNEVAMKDDEMGIVGVERAFCGY
jgi:hypothetical protein